ncbi:MAG: viroplasmin family protein [Dysgonomonas sp.]
MAKKNFYVVWKGQKPGVYDSWDDCKAQVSGYEGALYKSFASIDLAQKAFGDNPWIHLNKTNTEKKSAQEKRIPSSQIIKNSLAVDAACSGNPGLMEYRGVFVGNGQEIFHQGPFEQGTNNIGEFLALVHGLAMLKQQKSDIPIYSDSVNAIKWVKDKKCKTKLEQTNLNEPIFDLITRAEKWLKENNYTTQIRKWETNDWGEIPADFGRK